MLLNKHTKKKAVGGGGLPVDPTSYWTFDNISGVSPNLKVVDEQGNNDLISYQTGLSTPTGFSGNGGVLASSAAELRIGTGVNYFLVDTALTFSGVMKLASTSASNQAIIGSVNSIVLVFNSSLGGANKLGLATVGSGSFNAVQSSWVPTTDPVFFCIRLVLSGGTLTRYITVGDVTNSNTDPLGWRRNAGYPAGILCDSYNSFGSPFFPYTSGYCDELMMWKNTFLTDEQVAQVKAYVGL